METKMNDNGTVITNWSPIGAQGKPSSLSIWLLKYGLGLAILIILLLTSFLIWSNSQKGAELCLTKECIKISSTILERIDPSVDACDDMYMFACGNFVRSNAVPEDYYARNLLQEMQEGMFVEMKHYIESPIQPSDPNHIEQLKLLYMSCMNETQEEDLVMHGLEALYNLIIELTGSEWPLLSGSSAAVPFQDIEFQQQLAFLYLHQVQPFFQLFVAPHRKTTTYALHIFPGSSVMEQLNFGISKHLDNLTDSQVELYINFQREVIKAFIAYKGETERKDLKRTVDEQLQEMFRFEMDLINITKDMTQENGNCTYNGTEPFEGDTCDDRMINPNLFINISLVELNEEFPSLKWQRFFEFAFNDSEISVSHALIHSKEYFASLVDLLARHPNRTVLNYLGWSIIAKYMPYLGQQFKHLSTEFQQKILITDTDINEVSNGFKYYQSRWKQCVYIACESLKIPSIDLYLREHPENLTEMSKRIVALIEEMKKTFLQILDSQKWIHSEGIKAVFRERVGSINSNIGVPEYIRNKTYLCSVYGTLKINASLDLISNVFKINKHETIIDAKKINKPINSGGEWVFQPLDANAFYDFTSNDIIMPVGIIRKPLSPPNIPKYLQLPFLGIVIGHEIAHSIDINSRKHLSEASEALNNSTFNQIYKTKAQCFAERFSAFKVELTDQYVNGNTTLEENICDFASFQTVYTIFESLEAAEKVRPPGLEQFSLEQIFFLHYSQLWCEVAAKEGHLKSLQDNHSPGRFRANGVLMSSQAFAKAFNCPLGSNMNPAEKCDLWAVGH